MQRLIGGVYLAQEYDPPLRALPRGNAPQAGHGEDGLISIRPDNSSTGRGQLEADDEPAGVDGFGSCSQRGQEELFFGFKLIRAAQQIG